MRKIILTLALSAIALTINAQRTVDLELTEILKPDTIFHQVYPTVRFVVKNIGNDSILSTDSLAYAIEIHYGKSEPATFPDNNGGLYHISFNKKLMKDDTMIFTWHCPTYFIIKQNFEEGLAVIAHLLSGPGPNNVNDFNLVNDSKYKDKILFYNSKLSIVSNAINSNYSVFPNPIMDNSKIIFNEDNGNYKQVQIYDINGREIINEPIIQNEINIGDKIIQNGFYTLVITLQNNETIVTKLIK